MTIPYEIWNAEETAQEPHWAQVGDSGRETPPEDANAEYEGRGDDGGRWDEGDEE